jgi:hypothetical protein
VKWVFVDRSVERDPLRPRRTGKSDTPGQLACVSVVR